MVASEQKLFEVRQSAREGQKSQLLEQIDQLNQQIQGNVEQEGAKSREIDWVQQELVGIRGLWSQNLVPFSRLTTLEREAARLHGERGLLIAAMAQARVVSRRRGSNPADRRGSAHRVGKELAEIRGKKSELVEKRVAAEDQS